MRHAFLSDPPSPLRRPGIVLGIVVSLVLHALLIFGYRFAKPTPDAPTPPAQAMTVWLQVPKPPEQMARTEPPPQPQPAHQREKTASAARNRQPAPAIIAQEPAKPAESQAITLPPTTAPDPLHADQQAKSFDMNAALKTARAVANEKDPARAGLPVAQLDKHPLYPEDHQTQLQKGVASAKKDDCLQKGAGAGLLAPLVWVLDKHCKF